MSDLARLREKVQGLSSSAVQDGEVESRIRVQADFLRSVLESLPHPFYVIDASDYSIKLANSATYNGVLSENTTCFALTHRRTEPCSSEDHPCPLEIIKKTKEPVTVEHIHYDKKGRPRYVEVHGYPVFDDKGNVVQIIESSLDITDRKQAEKALEEAHVELQTFVDAVSHELKNPIFSIQGFSSLFMRRSLDTLDDKSKQYIGYIDKCAKQMEYLVRDLLVLSKIGKLDLSFRNIPAIEIIQSVLSANKERLKEKGIKIVVKKHLPIIQCDRERLEEVFQNLVSNAIKYTNPAKKSKIEIGYMDNGGDHCFSVKDNGIGIEPSHHDRIFKSFERLQEACKQEGTGLGLAIVKRIVTKHYGRVWVESEKNKGATFYFTLPKNPMDNS